jgi:hypothetical protein
VRGKISKPFDRYPSLLLKLTAPCKVDLYSDKFYAGCKSDIINTEDNSPIAIFYLENSESKEQVNINFPYVSKIIVYDDGLNSLEFSLYTAKNIE